MKKKMIEAFFDGCCEPVNPGGTASYGAVILEGGESVWECSEIFYPVPGKEKETSNNVAEYCGFIAILKQLMQRNLTKTPTIIRGDSNLVIQQQFGTWRVRGGFYVPLALEARQLIKRHFTKKLRGEWIPREQNTLADELSKAELVKAGIEFRIQPEDHLDAEFRQRLSLEST